MSRQELEEKSDEGEMMKITISNLKAIVWHLEQGHDNGKIKRIALASFLRSLIPTLEAAEQSAQADDLTPCEKSGLTIQNACKQCKEEIIARS